MLCLRSAFYGCFVEFWCSSSTSTCLSLMLDRDLVFFFLLPLAWLWCDVILNKIILYSSHFHLCLSPLINMGNMGKSYPSYITTLYDHVVCSQHYVVTSNSYIVCLHLIVTSHSYIMWLWKAIYIFIVQKR